MEIPDENDAPKLTISDSMNANQFGIYIQSLTGAVQEPGTLLPCICFSALMHSADRIAYEDEHDDTALSPIKGAAWDQAESVIRFWSRKAVAIDKKGCTTPCESCITAYGECPRIGRTYTNLMRMIEILFVELETARREYDK